MISKSEVKKNIKRLMEVHKIDFTYNESDDSIYSSAGDKVCSLDEYVDKFRRATGQSFESVYYCHATLDDIIRCTECGTVIFSSDDITEYDPNLRCPTCTDYKPYFKYWTKEEIESDEDKRNTISAYEEMKREEIEQYKRVKKRGKQDWEIAKSKFKIGSAHKIEIVLECDNITKSYFKGLRLLIRIWEREEDCIGYFSKKHIHIPLSWSYFYIKFIYVHLGRCHPSVRSKWYIGKAVEKRNVSKS